MAGVRPLPRLMSSADGARGRCPLDPRQRALPPGPLPAGAAPWTPARGRCPLDPRQRALPPGPLPGLNPGPRDAYASPFAHGAGRGLGALLSADSLLTGPHKGLRAGRYFAVNFRMWKKVNNLGQ